MSIPKDAFSAENRPPGRPRKYVSWSLPLRAAGVGFTEATSNDARGAVCANAIQRGANAPASNKPPKTTVLTTTPVADVRGENVRPRRSSMSIRSPMRDLLPKMPTARSSCDLEGWVIPGDKRRHECRRGTHECARHLVRIGLLDMFDLQIIQWSVARLQPESELLLNRGVDGWTGFGRRPFRLRPPSRSPFEG